MADYYLYRFLNNNGDIIYVGRTENMDRRFFSEEYAHFSQGSHLSIDCYRELCEVEYVELKTKSEQIVYEVALINKLRPKYNKEFIDNFSLHIEMPKLNWKIWDSFTDEYKFFVSERKDSAQSINEYINDFLIELISPKTILI